MKLRALASTLVVAANLSPQVAAAQVDCSLLDPRHSVSKEKEGKIAGSVETLYKVAKAGGNIEGRMEVDVRLNAGPTDRPFGLLLGATDAQFRNALGVLIRGDGGTEIARWTDNNYAMEMYLPTNPAIKTGWGAVNKFAVDVRDNELVYFINGTQVGRYRAASKIQGYIGFYTDYPGLHVGFDNLKVSQ